MKVRRVNGRFLFISLLVMLAVSVDGGVWDSLCCQASPISCETPKVILESGTAGQSTIYTNNTSAKVSVVAPAPAPTYHPNGYNITSGAYVSGTVPQSVEAADSDYLVVNGAEFTVSTEFLFSSMTGNAPTQLNFTVVSEYDIGSVDVTIQVWNYSSSAYVTSGEGYLAYTSTGANATKILSINASPQFCTSGGCAKINVTGVNSTITEFQQKINQVELTYEYGASPTYDHVLKVVNQAADNWTVNLQVYDNSSISRLSSLNITLHDGTSSSQTAISGGSIIKSEGEPYDLPGGSGSTVCISISDLQATTSDTSYLYVYLKIRAPDTSTYSLFVIAFEVT
jgi:hypothetical protein